MKTWYENNRETSALDFSRPIEATHITTGVKLLLLPQITASSYRVVGYNWFNLAAGRYNSCSCFKTPEKAVSGYNNYYIIRNVEIKLL